MKAPIPEAFTPNDVWFDILDGVVLSCDTAAGLAKWLDAEYFELEGLPCILIPSPRGDIVARSGDIVAKDAKGFVRVVRLRKKLLSGSRPTPLDVSNRVR